MNGTRRKQLARIHAWAGAILALPMLLIALSGASLLYKDALFVPQDWRITQPPTPALADQEIVRLLSLDRLQRAASIQPARGVRGFHVIEEADGRIGYWRVGAQAPETDIPLRLRLERPLLELHEHLLLGVPGDYLVRTIGPLVALLVVLGLLIWWPMRRGWRARDLLPRSPARPQLIRSHLALGAAAGLLCLVHASTGAMMANNPAIRAWLKPLTDPRSVQLPPAAKPFSPGDPAAAILALREVYGRGEITQLNGKTGGSQWSLKLRLPGEDHPNGRSNMTLDLAAGRIVAVRDARISGAPGSYDDTVFPLHVGTLFGPLQRGFWLAGALSLATLATLGLVSFLRRRPQGRRP